MKNEKGITLVALVMYVILFSIAITILATISSYIFNNLDNISSEQISSEEFNKFNTYFVSDVKKSTVATVESEENSDDLTIKLDGGSTYTYKKSENAIYKDKEKIARNIVSFTAKAEKDDTYNKNTIEINIKTGKNEEKPNFEKTIKYVLKYW